MEPIYRPGGDDRDARLEAGMTSAAPVPPVSDTAPGFSDARWPRAPVGAGGRPDAGPHGFILTISRWRQGCRPGSTATPAGGF